MADRPLTTPERAGYRLACRMLALWAAQIERNAAGLATAAAPDPVMARCARFARGLADALELAEDHARLDAADDTPRPPATLFPGAVRGPAPAPATTHSRRPDGAAGHGGPTR